MLKVGIIEIEDMNSKRKKRRIRDKDYECMEKLATLQEEFISKVVLLADYYGFDRDQITWIAGNAVFDSVSFCDFENYEIPVEKFDKFYAEIEGLK